MILLDSYLLVRTSGKILGSKFRDTRSIDLTALEKQVPVYVLT